MFIQPNRKYNYKDWLLTIFKVVNLRFLRNHGSFDTKTSEWEKEKLVEVDLPPKVAFS